MPTFEMPGQAPEVKDLGPTAEQIALVSNHENKLLRLLDIKNKIAELEESKKAVEQELIEAFQRCKVETIKTEYGRFTIVEPARKEYGEAVLLAEEELRAVKDEAEAKGDYIVKKGKAFIKVTV